MTVDRADIAIAVGQDISAEVFEGLSYYVNSLLHWNTAINLVSKGDAKDIWRRHIIDSARIWPLAPVSAKTWLDLGSGGGLPGIVVAILATGCELDLQLTLVESDQRKAVFLRKMITDLGLKANVFVSRAEVLERQAADVVSARALAPLQALLPMAHRHMAAGAVCLFPKGQQYQAELDAVRQQWCFDLEIHHAPAVSDTPILEIRHLTRFQEVGA